MKLRSFARHTLIGILIGLILTPGFISPPPAHAQFAVFDASNYAAKLEEMQRELDHWLKTVEHYTQMYDKAVQQVTSLGGILKTVDQQLARNKQLVASVAEIGKAVRDVYQLKRQIESMVQCRIRAVKSLDSRLKAGIFNPQQDLEDLEEYLRDSIGRSSQDTIANTERREAASKRATGILWIESASLFPGGGRNEHDTIFRGGTSGEPGRFVRAHFLYTAGHFLQVGPDQHAARSDRDQDEDPVMLHELREFQN